MNETTTRQRAWLKRNSQIPALCALPFWGNTLLADEAMPFCVCVRTFACDFVCTLIGGSTGWPPKKASPLFFLRFFLHPFTVFILADLVPKHPKNCRNSEFLAGWKNCASHLSLNKFSSSSPNKLDPPQLKFHDRDPMQTQTFEFGVWAIASEAMSSRASDIKFISATLHKIRRHKPSIDEIKIICGVKHLNTSNRLAKMNLWFNDLL